MKLESGLHVIRSIGYAPWKHVGTVGSPFYIFSSELNNISELGYWLAEIP
jgi:hypothetical protein